MKAKQTGGVDCLLSMLTYCRPAFSETEQAFCGAYLDNLPGVTVDKAGNRIARIGSAPVLWSSHTDTVHRVEGMQGLTFGDDVVSLGAGSSSSCLGADDTAGVWIMREMFLAGVSGLYIWHAGEEIGGVGSEFIARRNPRLLDDIECAIALDRKGGSSVITHQGARCCSDDFAFSLSRALGGDYRPDDGGLFTDTANYTGLVGECTNLGVGYGKAHSPDEFLDTRITFALLDSLKRLDTAALMKSRKPAAKDMGDWFGAGADEGCDASLEMLVRENPDVAAELLASMGVTADEFFDCIGRAEFYARF